MAQHYLRQPTVHRLPTLLEELQTGELRIPPFQRDFVWTGEQRLHLLDSVHRGLPAGSVMVWRTTRSLRTDPRIGSALLSLSEPPEHTMRQYLLDGRQRLTTLFAAFAPAFWSRDEAPLPEGWERCAPDQTPWAILFDLDTGEFRFEEEEEEEETTGLPLGMLLDDFAFDRWMNSHGGNDRARWKRARALKSAVVDYLIPVTPLHTDDLSAVTLTFKRVNRAGTPMGDLAMTRALSWTQGGFDLEAEIRDLLQSLRPAGWGELSEDTVLKVLASVTGMEPMGVDVEELAKRLRQKPAHLETLRDTLTEVVELFNAMGIAGPATLPYERALVVAAWTIVALPRPLAAAPRAALAGWLAAACTAEAFANTPPHVLRAMHREVLDLATGGQRNTARRSRWQPRRSRKFNMGWARSRVSAVALAHLKPLRADGKPMFDDAPRALGERGNTLIGHLLEPRGEGLSPEQKRQLASVPRHLRAVAANRVLCESRELPQLRGALLRGEEKICQSHAVPTRWTDLTDLLDQRDALLCEAEKRWLRDQRDDSAGEDGLSWKQEPQLKNLRR